MTRRLRFVVCGTTFGRVHLAALRDGPAWGELVGVLARGSARSAACAREYGVPLYTSVDELPDAVDAACVAVRAGVAGGTGSELAAALLDRGVHVLQEHPVHHDELADCLRRARRNKVLYRLNDHYPQLAPVRAFLRAAAVLRRHGPPRYVEAATSIQVAFALVDILSRALPAMRPWAVAEPAAWPEQMTGLLDAAPPLRGVDAVLGGVPVGIRVHNQLDPHDPDNHAHLMHRISVTTDAGTLTLADTHGPVLWSPRLHVTGAGANGDGPADGAGPAGDPYLARPSTAVLPGTEPVDYADVLRDLWPAAMARTMAEFAAAVTAGEDPMRLGQSHLTVCRVWQELTGRLGQPELIVGSPPPPVGVADLTGLDPADGPAPGDGPVPIGAPAPVGAATGPAGAGAGAGAAVPRQRGTEPAVAR
ncbi:Gfo/Idh/MocA family oxidoreductase [Polymorphospora sp. NPDC051019]|uniref:Gfo/Idh/MocA family oxidoreductase n=1 Tax=Polymorphospora sp. NPDC051019 TaxID=3155725 RepID=UPI003422C18D